MRSIRKTFRNIRKRLTRKRKLKSKAPSSMKKELPVKSRKIRERTKTPMIKRTTSSQRKTLKPVKTKCLKSINFYYLKVTEFHLR